MIPLYRFKLNEETGEISKTVITDYHVSHSRYKGIDYLYMLNGIRHDVHYKNLDKLVNWKVYSFNGDLEQAKKVILDNLTMRHYKAQLDVQRFSAVIKHILGGNDGENKQ